MAKTPDKEIWWLNLNQDAASKFLTPIVPHNAHATIKFFSKFLEFHTGLTIEKINEGYMVFGLHPCKTDTIGGCIWPGLIAMYPDMMR